MNRYSVTTALVLLSSLFSGGCVKPPSVTPISSPIPSISISPSAANIKAANHYRQLGLQYRTQGNYNQAIDALKKSVNLAPQNISGRVILGWTLHLAKKPQEAIITLQEALKQDPNNVSALNALGIVYLVNGNLSAAIETHRKAAQLQSDNEIAHYNLCLAYQRLKRYESAIIHGKKAITLEANNPHPWIALAIAYWSQGNKMEAQKVYNQAIQLDSRYREHWFLEHLSEAGFSVEQIQITEKLLR